MANKLKKYLKLITTNTSKLSLLLALIIISLAIFIFITPVQYAKGGISCTSTTCTASGSSVNIGTSTAYENKHLVIDNVKVYVAGDHTFKSVTIKGSRGILTHQPFINTDNASSNKKISINIPYTAGAEDTGNLILIDGGSINVDGAGYQGGEPGQKGAGPGSSNGISYDTRDKYSDGKYKRRGATGGASFTTKGGNATIPTSRDLTISTNSGPVYSIGSSPNFEPGSGAGGVDIYYSKTPALRSHDTQSSGGSGGGRIYIHAGKDIKILSGTSTISANGSNGTHIKTSDNNYTAFSGGGSGGIVWLKADNNFIYPYSSSLQTININGGNNVTVGSDGKTEFIASNYSSSNRFYNVSAKGGNGSNDRYGRACTSSSSSCAGGGAGGYIHLEASRIIRECYLENYNNIPAACEGKDVIIRNSSIDISLVKVNQTTRVSCSSSSDPNCDTKRKFNSLTLHDSSITHPVITRDEARSEDTNSNRSLSDETTGIVRWKKVDLEVIKDIVLNNSVINVSGKGYPGGYGDGYYVPSGISVNGYGPGGGNGGKVTIGCGGGYGGRGGRYGWDWDTEIVKSGKNLPAYFSGLIYPNPSPGNGPNGQPSPLASVLRFNFDPKDTVNNEQFEWGSGGGGSWIEFGGRGYRHKNGGDGGGKVRLIAENIILKDISSKILANGETTSCGSTGEPGDGWCHDAGYCSAGGGGGAGGSILIYGKLTTPTILSGGSPVSAMHGGSRISNSTNKNNYGSTEGLIYLSNLPVITTGTTNNYTNVSAEGGNGSGGCDGTAYVNGGGGGRIVLGSPVGTLQITIKDHKGNPLNASVQVTQSGNILFNNGIGDDGIENIILPTNDTTSYYTITSAYSSYVIVSSSISLNQILIGVGTTNLDIVMAPPPSSVKGDIYSGGTSRLNIGNILLDKKAVIASKVDIENPTYHCPYTAENDKCKFLTYYNSSIWAKQEKELNSTINKLIKEKASIYTPTGNLTNGRWYLNSKLLSPFSAPGTGQNGKYKEGGVWYVQGSLTIGNSPSNPATNPGGITFQDRGTIIISGDLTINGSINSADRNSDSHQLGIIVMGKLIINNPSNLPQVIDANIYILGNNVTSPNQSISINDRRSKLDFYGLLATPKSIRLPENAAGSQISYNPAIIKNPLPGFSSVTSLISSSAD